LEKKDAAVDLMKASFNAGHGFILYRYALDPEFLPFHYYPPYEEFVKPKG
jgi:hypothetical protein